MIYKFIEYDVIDLYDYILFYNIKKSILIDKNGHIVDCKLNNLKIWKTLKKKKNVNK